MGIATYKLLPRKLRDELPSLGEIEEKLSGDSEGISTRRIEQEK
jgi:hypothetical protein